MAHQSSNSLPPDQLERLWQHRQYVNDNFNNFVNFFLLSESILLAVVGSLADKVPKMEPLLMTIAILGLVLTFFWTYVQGKQKHMLDILVNKCEKNMPEYKDSRHIGDRKRWPISSGFLLTYILPAMFGAAWAAVLWVIA